MFLRPIGEITHCIISPMEGEQRHAPHGEDAVYYMTNTEVPMTKTANKAKRAKAPAKVTESTNPRKAKAAKRAPGDETALRAKANDNLKAVRAAKANPDGIATVIISRDQHYVVVSSNGGENLARPVAGDSKAFRERAVVGRSFIKLQEWDAANPAPKPRAKLARGIESRQAPHSAKAVADQGPEGRAKPAKGVKAPKAEKNKAPSKGVDRQYKVNAKAENKARPDSWRYHMTQMITGSTDTASAKAKHVKSGKFSANKLDFNWAANNGFITFTK